MSYHLGFSLATVQKLVKGSLLNFAECCDEPGKQRLTAGAVQPGGREGSREPLEHLVVHKGGYKKAGKRLFTRTCSDRTNGNDKLKEGSGGLD